MTTATTTTTQQLVTSKTDVVSFDTAQTQPVSETENTVALSCGSNNEKYDSFVRAVMADPKTIQYVVPKPQKNKIPNKYLTKQDVIKKLASSLLMRQVDIFAPNFVETLDLFQIIVKVSDSGHNKWSYTPVFPNGKTLQRVINQEGSHNLAILMGAMGCSTLDNPIDLGEFLGNTTGLKRGRQTDPRKKEVLDTWKAAKKSKFVTQYIVTNFLSPSSSSSCQQFVSFLEEALGMEKNDGEKH